jgi:hypothetical protein
MLFYIIYDQNKQINEYNKRNMDSLETELFRAQTNVARYEITLELLSQEDTTAAAKFDSIYKNETE